MKRLTCEMCGSTDLIKQDGVFVCQVCGCKYSVEEARKMMMEGSEAAAPAPVRTSDSGLVDNYLQMAENALDATNNEEAENYANKIIEIDPQAWRAWFIKGKAAGWQTTGRNNRYPESIVCWINAYKYAPAEERGKLMDAIAVEARNIGAAIVQMKSNNFTGFRSQENLNELNNAVSMVEKQMGDLKSKTDNNFDFYNDAFKTGLARVLNTGAVNASDATDKDFGPENRNRDKFSWNRYTAAQDMCLKVIDKAYALSYDDSLCITICNNYITIAKQVRDSCSYKWQYNEWSSEGIYVQDYSFTDEAKRYRTNAINEWQKKKEKHDPAARKRKCQSTLDTVNSRCGSEEKKLAIAQYWEAHEQEKTALEAEKTELEAKIAKLQGEIDNDPDKTDKEKLDSVINSLREKQSGLGLFKGKEKKALQAQIDEYSSRKKPIEDRWLKKSRELDDAQKQAKKRVREIEQEFTRERGIAKVPPKKTLKLFENGKLVPTGLEVAEYCRAVVPKGFAVKGEGEAAVENYTRTLMLMAKAMLALFSALQKNGDFDKEDLNVEDDPNLDKCLRIRFVEKDKDTHSSVNFIGKTPGSVITNSFYFMLEEEKTAISAANFIGIVCAVILGICPDIDLNALQKMIAEAAFGITPESRLEANGIAVIVTGSTKSDTKVELKAL